LVEIEVVQITHFLWCFMQICNYLLGYHVLVMQVYSVFTKKVQKKMFYTSSNVQL